MRLSQSQNLFHNLEYQVSLHQDIERRHDLITDIFKNNKEDNYAVIVPEITDIFKKDNFEVDVAVLDLAIRFVMKHHMGQYRDSGEPYVSHPIQVSALVNSWGRPMSEVVVAKLHDVVEDNKNKKNILLNDIADIFGYKVMGDVLILSTFEENRLIRDKALFNQILTEVRKSGDAGILYIKCADALSNAYTKKFMSSKGGLSSKERQTKYARGILKNALPIAMYLDSLQETDLNLSMYLKKLAK